MTALTRVSRSRLLFSLPVCVSPLFFFFFNDTATTEIYTLSLHDALPICGADVEAMPVRGQAAHVVAGQPGRGRQQARAARPDRKSTRLNSSHPSISYAVFCLKKKRAARGQPVRRLRLSIGIRPGRADRKA